MYLITACGYRSIAVGRKTYGQGVVTIIQPRGVAHQFDGAHFQRAYSLLIHSPQVVTCGY